MHIIIAVVTLTVNLIKIQVLSNPIKKKTTEKLDKHNKNIKHPLSIEKRTNYKGSEKASTPVIA